MNITKIKLKKDGGTIVFYNESEEGTKREIQSSFFVPLPAEFRAHLDVLRECVTKLLKLEDWQPMQSAKIIGISLSQNQSQGLGAVITALVNIKNISAPLVINTPHVYEISDGISAMPTKMFIEINELIKDTKKFIEANKDIQSDMFEKEKESVVNIDFFVEENQ